MHSLETLPVREGQYPGNKIAAVALSAILFTGILYAGGVRAWPSVINVDEQSYEETINPANGNAYILTEDSLVDSEIYFWSHRAGNDFESLKKAIENGATIIDVDLNDVDGVLYCEHGKVVKKVILGRDITIVIDPAELEISTRTPIKLEDLIKQVAALSSPGRVLILNTEFKGTIADLTITKMIDMLLKYDVPAIVRPGDETGRRLKTIRAIYDLRRNAFENFV